VIPRLPLGPHPCNAFALTPGFPSFWPATLQPLRLGREPKAKVATPTEEGASAVAGVSMDSLYSVEFLNTL